MKGRFTVKSESLCFRTALVVAVTLVALISGIQAGSDATSPLGYTSENAAQDTTQDNQLSSSYALTSAPFIALVVTLCIAAILVLVVVLCVGGGNSTMDQVRATASRTVNESSDGYYMNARFLNKHQSKVDIDAVMETGQQKAPPSVTQGTNTKGSNGHVAEVFETTGEEERDSFEEQCQEKVQAKKSAAKARGAKRSSIIVANAMANDLKYCYVPTLKDRKQLTKDKVQAKWEVTDIEDTAPREEAKDSKIPYWTPGSTQGDIFQQMGRQKFLEIPSTTLSLGRHLHTTEHSSTHVGDWDSPQGQFEVVVKSMTEGATDKEKLRLLKESSCLGQFRHANIVRFYGVVTMADPLMCVMEYLSGGDLRSHLLSYRSQLHTDSELSLLPTELLKFCRDIASGMEYLSSKGYVHRQLAAKNVLLSRNMMCKISKFGDAVNMEDNHQTQQDSSNSTVRWTSPEAVLFKKYNTSSDVWSYGMVLFEIWSLGHKPFEDIPNQKVLTLFNTGYCQPPPPGCPKPTYSIMVQCWNPDYKERPTFSEICQMLQAVEASILMTYQGDKVKSQMGNLGASLKDSYSLYKDLQETYTKSID